MRLTFRVVHPSYARLSVFSIEAFLSSSCVLFQAQKMIMRVGFHMGKETARDVCLARRLPSKDPRERHCR